MATLHNQDQVALKDVRPGDLVIVRKAGEVIPRSSARWRSQPGPASRVGLPVELSGVRRALERVGEESDTYCVNPACPAQLLQQIIHFASRGALDIEGSGTAGCPAPRRRLVSDVADLFSLRRQDLRTSRA